MGANGSAMTSERQDVMAQRLFQFDALVQPYYVDNMVHQSYLLTRTHVR